MDKRRRPIRKKVQVMVLTISIASLLLTSIMGILSMILIKSDGEDAMIQQMERDLNNLVSSKATLAESELRKYSGLVELCANYIHELYLKRSSVSSRYIPPVNAENTGSYAMQRALANRNISLGDVRDELLILGNLEHIWKAAIINNSNVITAMYLATKSGLLLCYDKQTPLAVPRPGENDLFFNYFSSNWYHKAELSRKIIFTDMYQDSFGHGKMITCAMPFYNEKNDFAGVVAMDLRISDLYHIIVDLNLGEGAYAFILDKRGNLLDSLAGNETNIRNLYYEEDVGLQIASQILKMSTGIAMSKEGTYFAYTTIPSTGWKFCVRIPNSTVLAPVRSVDRNIIITIFLFILAFVVVTTLVVIGCREFSDRLTNPITSLIADVETISDGNLDYHAEIHDNDEIGDLATAFNNMAVSLREYIEDFSTVTTERERIGTELSIATRIQAELLPSTFPPFPDRNEFDIYAVMNPAKEVGGDFYDFFFVDSDHLALVIADVSGKGVPAAIFMAISKTLIKNRAQMGGTPSEILKTVNNQLCEESKAELFVTVWLGILELSTGKVIAANAGHEYPAVRRANGAYRLMKLPNNPAVATLEGLTFRDDKFSLRPGDSIFLYTDGVAEATCVKDKREELYGTDRMIDALSRHANEPVEELLNSMKREVNDFVGDSPQFDDLTMLVLQYHGDKGRH